MNLQWKHVLPAAVLLLLSAGCGGDSGGGGAEKSASDASPAASSPSPTETASAPATPVPSASVADTEFDAEDAALLEGADLEHGAEVYATICLACHQKDGKGMNGMLGGNFIDDKTLLAKPNRDLLHSIAEGKQGKTAVMPPWKGVVDEQGRKDALAYIRATYGG